MSLTSQQLIIDFFSQFSIDQEQIKFDLKDNNLHISIELDDSLRGVFIGRHARTLDAFQFLLALMVNNSASDSQRLSITLDIGGYRQERYQRIIEQAKILAEEALAQKLAKSMPQLSATERRQIHLYFQDNDQITTYSQGEGEHRRLFIAPAA